ncbi:MAG: hypothetical protein PT957_02115 [Firmicutes bacterium]|nr:hypothetical protein [Bacillota bacterium]
MKMVWSVNTADVIGMTTGSVTVETTAVKKRKATAICTTTAGNAGTAKSLRIFVRPAYGASDAVKMMASIVSSATLVATKWTFVMTMGYARIARRAKTSIVSIAIRTWTRLRVSIVGYVDDVLIAPEERVHALVRKLAWNATTNPGTHVRNVANVFSLVMMV